MLPHAPCGVKEAASRTKSGRWRVLALLVVGQKARRAWLSCGGSCMGSPHCELWLGVYVWGPWRRLIRPCHDAPSSSLIQYAYTSRKAPHQDRPPRAARREEGEERDGLQELARLVHDHDGDAPQPHPAAAVVGEGGCVCVCRSASCGVRCMC